MNDIANASEKGRRTIYTYFKNKKEIYHAVIEQDSDLMVADMRAVLDSPLPSSRKLADFIGLRFRQGDDLTANASTLKSLFKFDVRRAERIRRLVASKERQILSLILDRGITDGSFRPDRVDMVKPILLDLINGLNALDIPAPDDGIALERRLSMRRRFIDFVISDLSITIPPGQSL